MATSRFWLYTLNNYDGVPCDLDFGKHLRCYVCQEELGENGTPHVQGYVEFKRALSLGAVRKMLPDAHWEIRRGTAEEAIAYCSKEETRVAGPYTFGQPSKGQGSRTDIKSAFDDLKGGMKDLDFAEKHTEVFFKYQRGIDAARLLVAPSRAWKTDVWYLYGAPGVGKSKLAAEKAPGAFYKAANSDWWDGYAGEPDVIFDDFTSGWFKWANLLQILDRYPVRVPVKGGFRSFLARRIFITSNNRPWDLYASTNADGSPKHPIRALLRRVDHYVEFTGPDEWTDHGSLDDDSVVAELLNL